MNAIQATKYTQHSPGPWSVRDTRTIVDGNDYPRAEVDAITCQRDPEQSAADANLIAAAPEMLEALRVLLSWVEGQKLAGVLPKGWDFQYAIDAVAKAEGH